MYIHLPETDKQPNLPNRPSQMGKKGLFSKHQFFKQLLLFVLGSVTALKPKGTSKMAPATESVCQFHLLGGNTA